MMVLQSGATWFEPWMVAVVAFSALLVGSVVSADTTTPLVNRQSQVSPDHQMQKIMGTIKKTDKVGAKDTDQQTLIVQLKTQKQEKNITVDLGNVEHLKDMAVQVGNRIIVWGRLVMNGDGHLFMAHRLWVASGTIGIKRP